VRLCVTKIRLWQEKLLGRLLRWGVRNSGHRSIQSTVRYTELAPGLRTCGDETETKPLRVGTLGRIQKAPLAGPDSCAVAAAIKPHHMAYFLSAFCSYSRGGRLALQTCRSSSAIVIGVPCGHGTDLPLVGNDMPPEQSPCRTFVTLFAVLLALATTMRV
jgi:hypothetical protein